LIKQLVKKSREVGQVDPEIIVLQEITKKEEISASKTYSPPVRHDERTKLCINNLSAARICNISQ